MDNDHPLKTYRDSQNPRLSQDDFAKMVPVSRPTVHRWETGARKIDEDLLPRIVEITGIPAKELRPDLEERLQKLLGVEP